MVRQLKQQVGLLLQDLLEILAQLALLHHNQVDASEHELNDFVVLFLNLPLSLSFVQLFDFLLLCFFGKLPVFFEFFDFGFFVDLCLGVLVKQFGEKSEKHAKQFSADFHVFRSNLG